MNKHTETNRHDVMLMNAHEACFVAQRRVHSTNKTIQFQASVHNYTMGALGAYQDVLWLLDNTHDPLGLNASSGTRRKRHRAIIQHALFDDVPLDEIRHFSDFRLPRSVATYEYSGHLLHAIAGTHPVRDKNWYNVSPSKRDQLWLDHFRMQQHTFDELFGMVAGVIPLARANPMQRFYSARTKLVIVLYFLDHCPTTRAMRSLFDVPHNTFTVHVPKPTITALHQYLYLDKATRVINFPSDAPGLQSVVDGFRNKHGMPGCAGAIDGTLLPRWSGHPCPEMQVQSAHGIAQIS
jgi:hypothetical protein